jgi:hypothetical protein
MCDRDMIEAAAAHWEALAAFAWRSALATGPGAVVLHKADLMGHAAPAMNWFAACDVPAGDDFRTLMLQQDPSMAIMLIVVSDQDDQAIVLQADGDRPSPLQCAQRAAPDAEIT